MDGLAKIEQLEKENKELSEMLQRVETSNIDDLRKSLDDAVLRIFELENERDQLKKEHEHIDKEFETSPDLILAKDTVELANKRITELQEELDRATYELNELKVKNGQLVKEVEDQNIANDVKINTEKIESSEEALIVNPDHESGKISKFRNSCQILIMELMSQDLADYDELDEQISNACVRLKELKKGQEHKVNQSSNDEAQIIEKLEEHQFQESQDGNDIQKHQSDTEAQLALELESARLQISNLQSENEALKNQALENSKERSLDSKGDDLAADVTNDLRIQIKDLEIELEQTRELNRALENERYDTNAKNDSLAASNNQNADNASAADSISYHNRIKVMQMISFIISNIDKATYEEPDVKDSVVMVLQNLRDTLENPKYDSTVDDNTSILSGSNDRQDIENRPNSTNIAENLLEKLDIATNRIKVLEAELDNRNKSNTDEESTSESYKEILIKLEESQKRNDEAILQRTEMEENLSAVRDELNALKSQETEFLSDKDSIQQLEAKVEKLCLDLSAAKEDEEAMKEKNTETLRILEQTKYELETQRDQNDNLRQKHSDLTQSLKDIQGKVFELQQAKDDIINEYETEKRTHAELESTICDLQASIRNLETDKRNIENDKLRIEELELLLCERDNEYNSQLLTLTSEKDKAQELIATLQTFKENSAEVNEKLSEMQKGYDDAVTKITTLTEENEKLKALSLTITEQEEAIEKYIKQVTELELEINAAKLSAEEERVNAKQIQVALENVENEKKNVIAIYEQDKFNLQQLLDDNQNELQNSKKMCEDLTFQCEELEDKLKEALECAQRSLNEVDGARDDILNLKKTTEDYQQLRLSYQELTRRVVDLENEKTQITSNYEERIMELQTSLNKTHVKICEITDNQVEIESDRNIFLKNALEESNAKAKSLEVALEYQEAQSAELLTVRENLIHELETSHKAIEKQKSVEESLNKSLKELSNNYEQLKDQSSSFTISQQDHDNKLSLLLEEAHNNYSLLEKNYDDERNKNSKLESTLNNINKRAEELRITIDEKNNKILELETSLHISLKDLEVSIHKQTLAQQSNDLLNERLTMQDDKLKQMTTEKCEMDKELQQISQQLHNKNIAAVESQKIVDKLSQDLKNLEVQYNDLQNHNELDKESSIVELSQKIANLQLQLSEVGDKNEVLSESLKTKTVQFDDVRNQLSDQEKIINDLKDHVDGLNIKLDETEKGRQSLLIQSSELRDSLQEITKEKELSIAKYVELVNSSTLSANEKDLYAQAIENVNTLTKDKVIAEQMYTDSLNERDKTIAERDYMLMQKDSVIRENMAALVEANATKNQLEAELKDNESMKIEISSLKSLLQKSEEDITTLKNKVNELQNDLEAVHNRCKEIEDQKASICEEKASLQERAEMSDKKIVGMEKIIMETDEKLENSYSQIKLLKEDNEMSAQKLKTMEIDFNSMKPLESKVHKQNMMIQELTASLQSHEEESARLKAKNEDISQELINFGACKEENKKLLLQIETLNQKISKQAFVVDKHPSRDHDIAMESLQDELEDVREEKESLEKQVNFLNDVIVDMQKKIVDASESIQKLEKKLIEKEGSHDNTKSKSPLGSPTLNFGKKGKLTDRPYCSFCEVFDSHNSDDCPKLDSSSLSSSPRRYNRRSRFSSSSSDLPFCDNCGQSGHIAEDCDDDTIF